MAKYDIEKFLTDLKTFIQNNLATKLTAIQTDKGDGLALLLPDNGAYFVQTMNNKEAAYDPYVWIGAVDVASISARAAVGKIYKVSVLLILADPGTDPQVMSRMFRYLRAFEELITENFTATRNDIKMEIETLVPIPITDQDGTQFRGTGVQIKVAWA